MNELTEHMNQFNVLQAKQGKVAICRRFCTFKRLLMADSDIDLIVDIDANDPLTYFDS